MHQSTEQFNKTAFKRSIKAEYLKNHYFWPAAGLAALVAVLSARQMIQLDAQQLLWGHRPLWLFLSVWALIALFGARLLERRGGVGVWK